MSFLTFLNIKDSSIETNPFVEKKYDNKKIFTKIYKNSYWQSGESKSGSGSDLKNLKDYKFNLDIFLKNIKLNQC